MFRILLRLVGYLMLAGAFVALVVDGTRSIAASSLSFLRIADVLDRVAPKAQAGLQAALEPLSPVLWDPVALRLLGAPLTVALLLFGILAVLGAAEREPAVGTLARR
jgi:hypothetical protein